MNNTISFEELPPGLTEFDASHLMATGELKILINNVLYFQCLALMIFLL